MFKDDFKKANDSIHADEELLNKVLSIKKQKKRSYTKYIPAAAAAVVVVSVSLVAFPKLMDRDSSGIIEESTTISDSSHSPSPKGASAWEKGKKASESEKSTPLPSSSQKPESAKNALPKATAKPAAKATTAPKAKSTAAPAAKATSPVPNTNTAPAKVTTAPVRATTAPIPTPIPRTETQTETNTSESAKTGASTLPEYTIVADKYEEAVPQITPSAASGGGAPLMKKKVNLNINYTSYKPQTQSMRLMEAMEDPSESYVTEEWDNKRYFEYLGCDLLSTVSLPDDFLFTGSNSMTVRVDEMGNPSFDSRIFPFEGNDERYVSIITSKDQTTANVYLSDENFVKSDIDGIQAVVICSLQEYKCYMIHDGVSYVITADEVSESEFEEILLSLVS